MILTKSVISFKKTVRKDKELLVILSCLQMSTSARKSNITVALEIEPSKKQKREKKSHANRSRTSRDVSEIKAISSQQMILKSKESEPKENKMKRSAEGMMFLPHVRSMQISKSYLIIVGTF